MEEERRIYNIRGLPSQSQGRHNLLDLFVNIRLSHFFPKHEPLCPLKGNTLAETTMVTDCHDKKLDILVKFFLLNNHLSKSRKLSFACFAKWYSITFYFAICTTWYVVVTTMTQISSALQSLILNVATVLIVIVSYVQCHSEL